ncbi:glycosyltransferase involved in cell wall biosynthesis [Salinibacter ruber]|uniref:glycosyltransferase n=1 Tax=Salinibacter ruber TaxID=146919 RepID=UPI002168A201|nr:glycosyltransferase involved in cell wall biosynthesis [Salinibacter ruber]
MEIPWRRDAATSDPSDEAGRPTVLFMAHLSPKKNVQGLLRAWAQVVADRPHAQLWVAGDGGGRSHVKNLVERWRLSCS